MESVELCEIVRDEDEQDGSVSQLIWRVENRDGQHTLLSYMLASFVLSNWRLQVTFPFRSKKKKISGFIVLTTQYTISRNGRWEEALQLITLIVHKENGVEERQVGF